MSDSISVNVPEDATPEEKQRLIDAAIDRRIEDDLDGLFGDFK
jgi:hypothetical protein